MSGLNGLKTMTSWWHWRHASLRATVQCAPRRSGTMSGLVDLPWISPCHWVTGMLCLHYYSNYVTLCLDNDESEYRLDQIEEFGDIDQTSWNDIATTCGPPGTFSFNRCRRNQPKPSTIPLLKGSPKRKKKERKEKKNNNLWEMFIAVMTSTRLGHLKLIWFIFSQCASVDGKRSVFYCWLIAWKLLLEISFWVSQSQKKMISLLISINIYLFSVSFCFVVAAVVVVVYWPIQIFVFVE